MGHTVGTTVHMCALQRHLLLHNRQDIHVPGGTGHDEVVPRRKRPEAAVQVAGRRSEALRAALNGGRTRSSTDWRMFQVALRQSGAQEPEEVAQQLQRSLSASAALRSDIEALLARKKQVRAP